MTIYTALPNKKPKSKFTVANQKRWQQTGQLARTAALLRSLVLSYPRLANVIIITVNRIDLERDYINYSYGYTREQLLKERKLNETNSIR